MGRIVAAATRAPDGLAVDCPLAIDLTRRGLGPSREAARERVGSISMKTRRNVSCEGMPFGRARKLFSHACLLLP